MMSLYISLDEREDTDKHISAQRSSMHNQPYVWAPVAPANPCVSLLNQSSQHAPEVVLGEGGTWRENRQQLIEAAGFSPGPRQTQSISREQQHKKAPRIRLGRK